MFVSFESRFPYAFDEKCVSLTSVLTPASGTMESKPEVLVMDPPFRLRRRGKGKNSRKRPNVPFNLEKYGNSDTFNAFALSMRYGISN
jgi:hypothetical protein